MKDSDEAMDLLRRRIGALRLSVVVLGNIADRDPARALAWIHGIENAADRVTQTVDQVFLEPDLGASDPTHLAT